MFYSGVRLNNQSINDFIVGGFTPVEDIVINPLGDWSGYLPLSEFQNNNNVEKMACVSFSLLNCLEVLYKYKTGKERNFSDRFLASASGTTKQGNYVDKVFDTARKIGLVDENNYTDASTSWDDYYKPISDNLFVEAGLFLKDWQLFREYIPVYKKDLIFNGLKSSPLQVLVRFCGGDEILNPQGEFNHAVMVYGAEYGKYWNIYDHYTQTKKKYDWNYEFGLVLKPTLINKNNTMFIPKNNILYQYVQGIGGFGLGLNGKLIVDDTAKLLASFVVRNNGDIKGKTQAMITADWNSCRKVNLKNEPIG